MVKLSKVSKYYGNNIGIENIDLEIKKGEIYGFIGKNGAGKSTTIRTILKYIKASSGEIEVPDKKNIGYLPSEINLYDDMTVLEMIKYNDTFYDNKYLKNGLNYAEIFKLDLDKKISDLSLGNKKKLGLVLTLMHKPEVLIFDEPTSGLDPIMQDIFFNMLKELKKKNRIIFLSSHNLTEVRNICDKISIIKDGHIEKVLSVSELDNNECFLVTVKCPDIKKKNLPLKDMIIKSLDDTEIKFIYKNDINELIKYLSTIKISKLLIEETKLEDIFMEYYKDGYGKKRV